MSLRDLFILALGNLWQKKLRSLLTIIGVVIAIATFTAMVSFGVGMQSNFVREFENLGLLTKIQVVPLRNPRPNDSTKVRLDDKMLERLRGLPDVVAAYPFESFTVTAQHGDSTVSLSAQGVARSYLKSKTFSGWLAGGPFDSDSSNQVLLVEHILEDLGFPSADSAMGQTIVIRRYVSSIDSGFVRIVRDMPPIRTIVRRVMPDSTGFPSNIMETARWIALKSANSFTEGYFQDKGAITDTLTVSGVLEDRNAEVLRLKNLVLPKWVASKYASSVAFDDPMTLFSAAREGNLDRILGGSDKKQNDLYEYSSVTLEIKPLVPHDAVVDSVRSMGLGAYSYEQQFKQMRVAFAIFDTGLGAFGFIALIIAALGIVNTMVMSILERYREIGVLKSLGAEDTDIHRIFLTESAVIGLIGSIFGILFGWVATRVAMVVVRHLPHADQMPFVDLFSLPVWLIGVTLLFGLVVSLVAGLYPAARAARVDPVVALRND